MFLNESSAFQIHLNSFGGEKILPFFMNTEQQGFIQRNFTIKYSTIHVIMIQSIVAIRKWSHTE